MRTARASFINREDILQALRAARRTPLLTCIAVVALSVGIGLNTAVFSILNYLLMSPPTRQQGEAEAHQRGASKTGRRPPDAPPARAMSTGRAFMSRRIGRAVEAADKRLSDTSQRSAEGQAGLGDEKAHSSHHHRPKVRSWLHRLFHRRKQPDREGDAAGDAGAGEVTR